MPKKRSTKKCATHWTTALISHASKDMLKTLRARLQHYVNEELPDAQVGFRKGRGTRNQIAIIHWIMEKARGLKKKKYLCFTISKPLAVQIIINGGKLLKRWECQITSPTS